MKPHLFSLILLMPVTGAAQLPEYFVDLFKGSVTVQRVDKKMISVKPLMLLYNNDIIYLKKPGDEVTIVNRNSQYIVLKSPGSYKLSDMNKELMVESEGVTYKYYHLVFEELLHPGKDYSQFRAKNMAGSWGGVVRGSCTILQYPYLNMVVASDSIRFVWKPDSDTAVYELQVKDESGSVIRVEVKDTTATLPLKDSLKTGSRTYYWHVNNLSRPCEAPAEYKFTHITQQAYDVRRKEIIANIPSKEKNYDYYLKAATALNRYGLYDAAAEYIVKAARQKASAR